jgi:hypothetical protein
MDEGREILPGAVEENRGAPHDSGSAQPAYRPSYCIPIPTQAARWAAIVFPFVRCFLTFGP